MCVQIGEGMSVLKYAKLGNSGQTYGYVYKKLAIFLEIFFQKFKVGLFV